MAELIADAGRWAANQPWALTPGKVREQPHAVTSRRRRRPPRLRVGVLSLVATALVVVAVSLVLVTASSSLSSAQIRHMIAQASALGSKAGTIRIDQVIMQKGAPTEHISRLVLPSGVSRFSYFDQTYSVYVTEVDNARPQFGFIDRARAAELGVTDRVQFKQGDAVGYVAADPVDVASCLGATWIGDGVYGTIDLLTRSLRSGGLVLIGEPYWVRRPSDRRSRPSMPRPRP